MSFTLDHDDTNSADDDLDSLDIVISDNTSHQSQQVQPLIT
ncbi:3052_t:CDS:1, partial [Rhizophagus irregularis]